MNTNGKINFILLSAFAYSDWLWVGIWEAIFCWHSKSKNKFHVLCKVRSF